MIQENTSYKTKSNLHGLGHVLKSLMKAKKTDDTRLALATGVAISNISRMKHDPHCNPTLNSLLPIAQFFNVSLSQLIGETPLKQFLLMEPLPKKTLTIQSIPILPWDKLCDYFDDKFTEETKNWLPSNKETHSHSAALQIFSQNWGNLFPYKAFIIVEPIINKKDGAFVIIKDMKEKKIYPKQLIIDGNQYYLKSLNPSLATMEPMVKSQNIIATIIEVRHFLD